jgi:hypothetical protein
MKTLWEKLSAENKSKLEVLKLDYPTSFGGLIETLKKTTSWIELTVYDANTLLQETSEKDLSINDLHDLFYEN